MILNKAGFDNEKYLNEQSAAILDRISGSGSKLYLEFGGKIMFDYHASRVLPGFDPNVKMKLLQKLRDKTEIILCIYSGDIERKKVRADFGITYDTDVLKTIDDFNEWGIEVGTVVITRYENQPSVRVFKNNLQRRGIKVYTHNVVKDYPENIDVVVSKDGYGSNEYIKTERPIVVVTGPGPGSGKLATCLSQLYHEYKNGFNAVYAKFETFPIWNMPLKHPVNVAYEAATADLKDVNLVDHFHLEAYDEVAVNYNRDIEAFPLLRRIIEKITGEPSFYKSPTDMGVNRAGFGIIDDDVVREAAKQEIIRRYFRYSCEYAQGFTGKDTVHRVEMLLDALDVTVEDRKVVTFARKAADDAENAGKGSNGTFCGAAMELPDGTIITGKNSPLLHAASSLVLNAAKHLAGIPDNIDLIPLNVIESLKYLKKDILKGKKLSLDLNETLIALGLSATSNPSAKVALDALKELKKCEVHITHMPTPGDDTGLRKLGVNLTTDPNYASKDLFIS